VNRPRRQTSLAHLTVLDTTPPELVTVAASAGFRTIGIRLTATPSVGVPPYDILHEGPMLRETLARLADTGVSASLLGVCESFAGPSQILLRPIPRILMWGLLLPETCEMLAVPRLEPEHLAYRPLLRATVRIVNGVKSDVFQGLPDIAGVSALFSRRLLEDIVAQPRGGARTAFRIPEQLARSWGIAPTP
jgi:hypothetical protein